MKKAFVPQALLTRRAVLRNACLVAVVVAFVAAPAVSLAGPFIPCGAAGRGPCILPIPGPGIPTPPQIPGKEYSDHLDKNTMPPGVLDPEQNIAWDGVVPGGIADTFDYSLSRINLNDTLDREVDALANNGDALFQSVIANTSALLFSVDLDPDVHVESIAGGGGLWAAGVPVGANDIDQHGVRDLDGLEVWGDDGPMGDDADRYSLEFDPVFDPATGRRIAVFDFTAGVSIPAFFDDELATGIALLDGLDIVATDQLIEGIDVDATMVFGQSIMFSIDPVTVTDASGLVRAYDGGEVFVWTRPAAGAAPAAYLSHGGHLWNTPFGVAGAFGLPSENVNALEAVSVPEPLTFTLSIIGTLALLTVGRRRHAA